MAAIAPPVKHLQFPAEIKDPTALYNAALPWTWIDDSNGVNAFVCIFILVILTILFFLPYPVGNDVYRYVWES